MFVLCIDANKCYFHSVEVHSYFEARYRLWFADRLIFLQDGEVHREKKMAFSLSSYIWSHHNISLPKMSRAQLLDVFMEQHLCNSVWFDLGAGVRCVPSGSWLEALGAGQEEGHQPEGRLSDLRVRFRNPPAALNSCLVSAIRRFSRSRNLKGGCACPVDAGKSDGCVAGPCCPCRNLLLAGSCLCCFMGTAIGNSKFAALCSPCSSFSSHLGLF